MDLLERKLSGAVFNVSIRLPKSTESSPRVHHVTLPAPELPAELCGSNVQLTQEGSRIDFQLRNLNSETN